MYRLLLVQARGDEWFSCHPYLLKDPKEFRRILLSNFPEMEKWLSEDIFDIEPIWPDLIFRPWTIMDTNVSGNFLAQNIKTPTKVMNKNASPERVINELEKAKMNNNPFTHVGFSVYINGYTKFVETAKAVRQFDNKIIIIAGNVGCFFPETKNYVDYMCIPKVDEYGNVISGTGDGVPFLRKILKEDGNNQAYKCSISSCSVGIGSEKYYSLTAVTKLGCPMKCDFCITNRLFNEKFMPTFITPEQFYKKYIEYTSKLDKRPNILFCEPTSIINKKWWYELFRLFKNEPEPIGVNIATTLASLKNFDWRKIENSSLHFAGMQIGIESYSHKYAKNLGHRNNKEIIRNLTDNGISSIASFIIGFSHQNHRIIWDEIEKLADLECTEYYISNLKPLPGTPFWSELKSKNLLIEDLPIDFYYINGFQTFKHPYFKPGFEDMFPLLGDIHRYLIKERGFDMLNWIELYFKKPTPHIYFKKQLKLVKRMSKSLFPSWKEYLNPTPEQIDKYQQKLNIDEKEILII